MSNSQNWEEIVSQKRTIRERLLAPYLMDDVDQRLPRVHHVEERTRLKDPLIQKITDIDSVADLLVCLENGEFQADQVIKAYIERYVCYPKLNRMIELKTSSMIGLW
jgi:amidase